jgi:hypothetical protein
MAKRKGQANCHLIPECFGVSNVTVWLDADFDSRIGHRCDVQLSQFFQVMLGDALDGRIALRGGSQSRK